jgi:adenosylhomocysteine nucleosidase
MVECHDDVMADSDRFRVGLLAPMPSELKPVVQAMNLQRAEGQKLYRGTVGGVEVFATRTGMGMQMAREATAHLLDEVDVDHVMVVGIAGGMGHSKVGDVLFPEVVVNKHTRVQYKASPLGATAPHGKTMTHDDFDIGPDYLRELVAEGFLAVDMETAAVAEVCEQRGRPWTAVRVISDLVGVTPGDVITLANPDGSPNIVAGLRYMITKPWQIPKLVKLGRDSFAAANTAAKTAARVLQTR